MADQLTGPGSGAQRPSSEKQPDGDGRSVDTPARRPGSTRGRQTVLLSLALLFGVLAVVALVHRTVDFIRGAPVQAVSTAGGALRTSGAGFAARAAALAETSISGRHQVEILVDDAFFPRLLADLASARTSVTFLGYYCDVGEAGLRIAEVLTQRARAGVRVLFLGDAFGCGSLLDEIRPGLQAAGAEVAAFRPVRWYTLHRAQHRMHARSVVIDGSVGYTGGFGVDDKWIKDQPDEPMWRETSARFTGPAVLEMQATFLGAWAEATGELVAGDAFFPVEPSPEQLGRDALLQVEEPGPQAPPSAADDGVQAGLLYSRPAMGPTTAERFLALTIASAERTLFVSNSYFVPTAPLRRLLMDAAQRGVDVRVLVPGERTDIPSTRWAGRGFYEELLTAGVRIWEYQPSMMHAKTLVADGVWAAVGSLNLDNRSIRLNDESALLVFDRGVGALMDSIFIADLESAEEVTLERHARRSWTDKILELGSRLLAPLL